MGAIYLAVKNRRDSVAKVTTTYEDKRKGAGINASINCRNNRTVC